MLINHLRLALSTLADHCDSRPLHLLLYFVSQCCFVHSFGSDRDRLKLLPGWRWLQ